MSACFSLLFAWLCCGILSSLNLKLWRNTFLGPDFWPCVVQGLFFFAAGQPGMKWCAEHGFHRSFFQGVMFLLEQLLDSYNFIHIRTHSYFLLELIHGSVVLEPRFHGLWSRSQGPIDQQIVSDGHNIPSCVGSKDLKYVYWSHLFVVYSPLVDQRKKTFCWWALPSYQPLMIPWCLSQFWWNSPVHPSSELPFFKTTNGFSTL